MLNIKKKSIQENAIHLADKSKNAVNEVTEHVKQSAEELKDKIVEKSDQSQEHALNMINSIKNLIKNYDYEHTDVKPIAERLKSQANELQHKVRGDVTESYHNGKQKTAETVQKNPLGSLLIVAGAGLFLGYLLGAKRDK